MPIEETEFDIFASKEESLIDFSSDIYDQDRTSEYGSRSLILLLEAEDTINLVKQSSSTLDVANVKFCVSLMKA